MKEIYYIISYTTDSYGKTIKGDVIMDFADSEELATKNKRYVVSVASHVTVVLNNKVWDTWNCGWKSVGNYWERKEGAR